MSRSQVVDTEEEVSDTMQEPDLVKLQRQMRVLENNRRSYMDQVKGILRKQETEYEVLKRDNDEIQLLLHLMKTQKQEQMNAKDSRLFSQLVELYDDTKQKIEENKEAITRLDDEINAMQRTYDQQQQMIGLVFRCNKKPESEKRIRAMENRLEKMTTQFNKQLTHNTKLRSQVDDVRQERKTYDKIYRRLVQELENERSQINNLLQDATHSYDEREEARQKIVSLQERNVKDSSQHEIEVRKYDRSLQHDKSLDSFMALKSKDHSATKQERVRSMKKEEKDLFVQRQQLDTYEEALERIRAITGDTDLENIITKFQGNEEENFALFKYINELNTEIESYTESIRELERDIFEIQETGAKKRKDIQDQIHSIKDETISTAIDAEKGKMAIVETQKVLEEFKVGIISILKVLQCDSQPFESALAADTEVNEGTILLYMGSIDQRITELLLINQFLEIKQTQIKQHKTETTSSPFPSKPGSAKINRQYLSVVPPDID